MTFQDRRKEKGEKRSFTITSSFLTFILHLVNSSSEVLTLVFDELFSVATFWLIFSATDECDATLIYTLGLVQLSSVAIRPHVEEEAVIDTELLNKLTSFHRIASVVSERTLFLAIKDFDTNYDHKEYVEFLVFSKYVSNENFNRDNFKTFGHPYGLRPRFFLRRRRNFPFLDHRQLH